MLYISKIDHYLKILIDEEVEYFLAINFSEYFKSIREEQNLRKAAKSLYIFLITPDEIEKYVQWNPCNNCIRRCNVDILNIFGQELQLINTKPMIKNKLKEFLSKLKKLKIHAILVLDYKKRYDCNIFHSSTKLIASDSGIDESFKSMHQSIMTKIKNYACKD